jgi:outer membrane immunogenic protein
MRTCHVGILIAAAMLVAGSANAADRWNGPYIGANVGYGAADLDGGITVFNPGGVPYAAGPLHYGVDAEGLFGGIQLGINYRNGWFLAGLEADLQSSGISGTSSTSFTPPVILPFTYHASMSTDWFATVRGRMGLVGGNTLLYVTGGWAVGDVDYSATYQFNTVAAFASLKGKETQQGYTLGAGIEQALGAKWSLKLEYQYLNLGDQNAGGNVIVGGAPNGEKVKTAFDAEFHTVRLGMNYRFGS